MGAGRGPVRDSAAGSGRQRPSHPLGLLLVALLIWARSDRVWAVRPQASRGPVPVWPRLLMMFQLSVLYLFAGLSKINSVFPSGQGFDLWLRWDLPMTLDMSMAFGTILTELFIAVALWFPDPRPVALVLGASLHLSIVVMMADQTLPLVAFALTCVPLYGLFVAPMDPAPPPPVGVARVTRRRSVG